jgi:sterol 3beta-glucosyltransferase
MRPAAGAIGLVAHPLQGAWRSLQKNWATELKQSGRSTRIRDGEEDVKNSSKEQRHQILDAFEAVKKTVGERKKKYKEEAETVMYGMTDREAEAVSSGSSRPEMPPASSNVTREQTAPAEDDGHSFERDLEMAKRLSLREYERDLTQQPAAS